MKPSPLQLESYAFTRIHMDACENPESMELKHNGQFQVSTRCQQHNENPSRWMVTMSISVGKEEDNLCSPYSLGLEVVGFFKVADDGPADKQAALVRANGPAVLFGSVREMVAGLTARGPYPRVDLPTVTFMDEAHKKTADGK